MCYDLFCGYIIVGAFFKLAPTIYHKTFVFILFLDEFPLFNDRALRHAQGANHYHIHTAF